MDGNKAADSCRLVEFYDEEYLENVISLLHRPYTAVTYVYFTSAREPDRLTRNALRRFIMERWGIAADFLAIGRESVSSVVEAFEKLTAEERCDFDVTGGPSVFIAAAGAVAGRFPERKIGVHEYDPATGRCLFCWPEDGGADLTESPAQLTVEEIMALQKVEILKRPNLIRYELDRENLGEEILKLWDTVRPWLREWNTLSVLPVHRDGPWVQKRMSGRQWQACAPMLEAMERKKLISGLEMERGREVLVRYRLNCHGSADVLYEKGGNLLELLTYLALERSGGFSDCCTGVVLDWELEDRPVSGNPINELDVLGVRKSVPYFISCKNAQVKNEFLYEILTITRHFGGRYGVPVLVTTAWCSPAIRTRAKEMGILLIEDLRRFSGAEICERIRKRLCKN